MITLSKPASVWQHLKAKLELSSPAAKIDPEREIRLAAAVLMVEMARVDAEHSDSERQALAQLLTERFGLSSQETATLVESAEQTADKAISLHEYLTALNIGMDRQQKQAVLKMLWQVAYADKKLNPHEENLLRQISDLLYLDHADFIRTKLQVLGQA